MPVALKGATSGQVTLDVPAAAGTNTLTLPAKTGNIITSADSGTVTGTMLASATVAQSNLATNVAGNGPTFLALNGAAISVANATKTKITFATPTFDTNSNVSSSRFTPTVAGYYSLNSFVQYQGTTDTTKFCQALIYKNGAQYSEGSLVSCFQYTFLFFSIIMYFNGSTDYVEVYAQQTYGSNQNMVGVQFSGALVRAA